MNKKKGLRGRLIRTSVSNMEQKAISNLLKQLGIQFTEYTKISKNGYKIWAFTTTADTRDDDISNLNRIIDSHLGR